MHNILITGHEGFIGTQLWKRLSTKHDLMGLDIKSGDDILTCDLPHPNAVEVVIHLAGCLLYTSPSPRDATLSRMPSSA